MQSNILYLCVILLWHALARSLFQVHKMQLWKKLECFRNSRLSLTGSSQRLFTADQPTKCKQKQEQNKSDFTSLKLRERQRKRKIAQIYNLWRNQQRMLVSLLSSFFQIEQCAIRSRFFSLCMYIFRKKESYPYKKLTQWCRLGII